MAAANRQLQQQVGELGAQLQAASALQAEAATMRQRNSQLEQQNTDLQAQLQAAARAWGDKHRQHKESLARVQAAAAEALAENKRVSGLLKEAEQVPPTAERARHQCQACVHACACTCTCAHARACVSACACAQTCTCACACA